MSTVRLLFWSGIGYSILLALVRGVFPSESAPTISLTGIPLIVIVIMIARDLARKSTSPTFKRTLLTTRGFRGDSVQFLGGQFRVAADASNSYFEDVVRLRLKELLIAKISLEAGLEKETARQLLADVSLGPGLVKDEFLYSMLYGTAPQAGQARLNMIGDAIDLIGAWTV